MLMRIIAQPLLNENSLFSQELSTNPHVENVDSVDNFEDNIIGNLNKPRFYKKIAVVGIITNDFHMFRAMQITKGEGLKSAKAIAAGSNPLYLPNNMLREYLAEWKYLIRSIL